MFGSFVYWVNGALVLCMPRRLCGSFGWRRVHDDTPVWIWSGLSTVVVWLRSFDLSLLGRVSVFGRTCLYSSVVSYYTFYDGGLRDYGLLMIVILNMTIRVMNYVMWCRLSGLNEDDLQPPTFTPHGQGSPISEHPQE